MPFAATLAFIDSIQDDMRDIEQLNDRIRFLEKLLIRRPYDVCAKLNPDGLREEEVLWKIIEARDVLAHLQQDKDTLTFTYPQWLVG